MGWVFHNSVDKKGMQAVIYQVYYNSTMFTVSTSVRIKKVKGFKGRVKNDIRATTKLQTIENIIQAALIEAKSQLPYWTTQQLKERIKLLMEGGSIENGRVKILLKDYWDSILPKMKDDNRDHSINSQKAILKQYPNIYLHEVTKLTLRELKVSLAVNRSPSTVVGYLTDLRVIIYWALDAEIIDKNPFLGFKMPSIPESENKALTVDELMLFEQVQLKSEYQTMIRDMQLFRIDCLGMRIKDALELRAEYINEGRLMYRTNKNKKLFNFRLTDRALDIVNKYKSKSPYVFPILKTGTRQELINKRRSINKTLKRIAKHAGITTEIRTHTFRHTFAAMNEDISDRDMQNALGHQSETTTRRYRGKFTNQDHLIKR